MKHALLLFCLILLFTQCTTTKRTKKSNNTGITSGIFRFYGAEDSALLLSNINATIKQFVADVNRVDGKQKINQEAPSVIIKPNPGLISYRSKENQIALTLFEQVPARIKEYLIKFTGDETKAKDFYGTMVYGYVVIHEMGHWLQQRLPNPLPTGFDNEYLANQIAVAYLTKTGRQKELQQFYQYMKNGLKNVPPSFSSTENLKEYLTNNYMDIIRKNPGDYNAIQGIQVIEIVDSGTKNFDELIKSISTGSQ